MQIQLIYGEIGDGLLLLYSHYIDNAIDDIAIIYIYTLIRISLKKGQLND